MGAKDRDSEGNPTNLEFNNDGTVWKKHEDYSKYKRTFPIFDEYELDFMPKILEWNDEGYRYKYVDGVNIREYLLDDWEGSAKLTQKMIFEMKIAMDDIWKKLYQISIEKLNGEFLWYGDPISENLIWNDDTKKLTLLDLDSFEITTYVPISDMTNRFIQQFETQFIIRRIVY